MRPYSLTLTLALALLPAPESPVRRDESIDIARLKSIVLEYRGIRANFEELSIAYALKVYEGGKVLQWKAKPSRRNPHNESIVTGTFATGGPRDALTAAAPGIEKARRQANPTMAVAWRVNTLGEFMITAENLYAEDAIEVFQQTVDSFVDRMVVVLRSTELHENPNDSSPVVMDLDVGTVLLFEDGTEGWSLVRLPSTKTVGWCRSEQLVATAQ